MFAFVCSVRLLHVTTSFSNLCATSSAPGLGSELKVELGS